MHNYLNGYIMLSVLQFTDSDNPFGIFKLFLCRVSMSLVCQLA